MRPDPARGGGSERVAVARALVLAWLCFVGGAGGCRPRHAHEGGVVRPDEARALFHGNCALCHGDDGRAQNDVGRGAGAKDLTSAEVQGKPDAAIRHQILFGRGRMPPFASVFDDAEVDALVRHVRTLARR